MKGQRRRKNPENRLFFRRKMGYNESRIMPEGQAERKSKMKKYTKQFIVVLCAAAVLLALSAVLRNAGGVGGLARTLKGWGVDLPKGYVVEYRAATDSNMDEGGLRFHVLLYEDGTALDAMVPWGEIAGLQTGYGVFAADEITTILDALNVPGGERPDLQSGHVWQCETVKDGFEEEIFLLHTEGDLRLYLVESFQNP